MGGRETERRREEGWERKEGGKGRREGEREEGWERKEGGKGRREREKGGREGER